MFPSTYWRLWGIISVVFAIVGALTHSLFLLLWNMGWLAIYIYLYNKAKDTEGN